MSAPGNHAVLRFAGPHVRSDVRPWYWDARLPVSQRKGGADSFLLQVLNLLPDRGPDLVLIEFDRKSATLADPDFFCVYEDEPSTTSLREALAKGSARSAPLEPSAELM